MSEEPESYSRQNYKGLDNWTHPHVRYSKPFLQWTKEIKQMYKKTNDHA